MKRMLMLCTLTFLIGCKKEKEIEGVWTDTPQGILKFKILDDGRIESGNDANDPILRIDSDGDIFLRGKWIGKDSRITKRKSGIPHELHFYEEEGKKE